MSEQCHCPEQGLDESCGMCKFEAERDALKARVGKLEKGLKEIASDSLCCGSCSDCCTYEAQKLAKAALDEDGGN